MPDALVNIGRKGRRGRLVAGVGAILAAVGLALVLARPGVSPWLRALVALPLFVGALGLLQAKEGT